MHIIIKRSQKNTTSKKHPKLAPQLDLRVSTCFNGRKDEYSMLKTQKKNGSENMFSYCLQETICSKKLDVQTNRDFMLAIVMFI